MYELKINPNTNIKQQQIAPMKSAQDLTGEIMPKLCEVDVTFDIIINQAKAIQHFEKIFLIFLF